MRPIRLLPLLLLISLPGLADILIGVAGPMSGPKAWSGEQFRRGAQLAVDDINSAGGVLAHRR